MEPSVFGREDDLAALRSQVQQARLVSLVAPGGTGKTTLARAVLRGEVGPGLRAFADLQVVNHIDALGSALASALGLSTAGASSALDAVTGYLADRDAFLVLDNVEQIAGMEAWVEALLRDLPRLRVLATSRVPLRADRETVVRLGGLRVPDGPTLADVEESPAGALFLLRARSLGRLAAPSGEDADAIATLCRRVDGMPLAIELAAARSRLMSPAAMIARLSDPRLLARTDPEPDDRHASLAVVLDWTLSLLAENERRLLDAVAFVRHSWDIDLASALVEDASVIDALHTLIEVGLVAEEVGTDRFRTLEVIRTHVVRDVDQPQAEQVVERFARYMAGLAGVLKQSIGRGTAENAGATRFAAERPNFEMAAAWFVDHDPDTGLPIFPWLHRFWWTASDAGPAIRLLRELLERADPTHPVRSGAMATLMMQVIRQDGGHAAMALASDVIAAADQATSPEDRRACLTALAQAHVETGQWAAGAQWLFATAQAVGDPATRAMFLASAMTIDALARGDFDAAERHLVAAVEAAAASGDLYNQSANLFQAAMVRIAQGHVVAALEAAEAAAAIGKAAEFAFDMLAIARARGLSIDRAWDALAEGWAVAERATRWDRLRMLDAAAIVLDEARVDEASAMAHVIAARETAAAGWPRWPPQARIMDRSERSVRRRLGEARMVGIRAAATGIGADAFMRSVLAAGRPRPSARLRGRREGLGELTAREVEVLALVGESRSDREIAETLGISPKTASVHVANIREKLGAMSRLDVALHARSIGLAGRPDRVDRSRPHRTARGDVI